MNFIYIHIYIYIYMNIYKKNNIKNITIEIVLNNFPEFKNFMKLLSNKKFINTRKLNINTKKLNYLSQLDANNFEIYVNKFSDSEYENVYMEYFSMGKKSMKGGSIISEQEIFEECKKNAEEGYDKNDPLSFEYLGNNDNRIVKDDSFEPNAYCFNETSICDNGILRQHMQEEPFTRSKWSQQFLDEIGCVNNIPLDIIDENNRGQWFDEEEIQSVVYLFRAMFIVVVVVGVIEGPLFLNAPYLLPAYPFSGGKIKKRISRGKSNTRRK